MVKHDARCYNTFKTTQGRNLNISSELIVTTNLFDFDFSVAGKQFSLYCAFKTMKGRVKYGVL